MVPGLGQRKPLAARAPANISGSGLGIPPGDLVGADEVGVG